MVEDLAGSVLYLASEEASFVTGDILPVGGGRIFNTFLRNIYEVSQKSVRD
jgi:NAD(P)-dependent dehydrogenase (short-subunit alcohol dehydrogenase family)